MPESRVYVRRISDPDLTVKRPQYVYESTVDCPLYSEYGDEETKYVTCQLTTNVNETTLWCAECGEQQEWTRLTKSFQSQGTNFAAVWHEVWSPTTGQLVSDPRQFKEQLHVASREMEERLGGPVDYQPIDMTDPSQTGVTDEGMDATHDRAVAEGRKDSRGRFVW